MTQYAGLIINFDIILAARAQLGHNNILSNMKKFSRNCFKIALGSQTMDIGDDNYTPFATKPEPGNDSKRSLILVLPFDLVQAYRTNPDTKAVMDAFEAGIPFQYSLGHCWITWQKDIDVCGIWDICLHKESGKGLGNILTESIIDTLAMELPNSTTLWLGIDINNRSFSKIAYLYAKFGFQDPYISSIDPFGNNWEDSLEHGFVALSRSNDYLDPEDIKRREVERDILYLLTQYVKVRSIYVTHPDLDTVNLVKNGLDTNLVKGTQGFCSVAIKFNKSYAKWLSKLPINASTLNIDGSITQKEVSGVFSLDDAEIQQDGSFIWEVTVDKGKGINATDEEKVELVHGRYNFHTHPREAYDNHGVGIGFPSGQDYNAFLDIVRTNRTIFHCVIALEGIYILSIQPYWCTRIDILDKYLIEYGTQLSGHIATNFELEKVIPEGMTVEQAGKNYCTRINQMQLFTDQPPVYKCDFLSWNEIFSGSVVELGYPVTFNQCFATERSLLALKKFNPELF